MKEEEIHLVKRVSKELGLTYRELGEKIGYTEGSLKAFVSKNQINNSLQKSLELYLETLKLKKEIEESNKFKEIIRNFVSIKS